MSKHLLTIFDQLYLAKVGSRYPVNGGKDGKLLKGLREIYSDDDIERYMRAFFEIDDEFIEQSGYGIGAFRGCLPKVIAFANRKPRAVVAWTCPHVTRCSNREQCANATVLNRPVRMIS